MQFRTLWTRRRKLFFVNCTQLFLTGRIETLCEPEPEGNTKNCPPLTRQAAKWKFLVGSVRDRARSRFFLLTKLLFTSRCEKSRFGFSQSSAPDASRCADSPRAALLRDFFALVRSPSLALSATFTYSLIMNFPFSLFFFIRSVQGSPMCVCARQLLFLFCDFTLSKSLLLLVSSSSLFVHIHIAFPPLFGKKKLPKIKTTHLLFILPFKALCTGSRKLSFSLLFSSFTMRWADGVGGMAVKVDNGKAKRASTPKP